VSLPARSRSRFVSVVCRRQGPNGGVRVSHGPLGTSRELLRVGEAPGQAMATTVLIPRHPGSDSGQQRSLLRRRKPPPPNPDDMILRPMDISQPSDFAVRRTLSKPSRNLRTTRWWAWASRGGEDMLNSQAQSPQRRHHQALPGACAIVAQSPAGFASSAASSESANGRAGRSTHQGAGWREVRWETSCCFGRGGRPAR